MKSEKELFVKLLEKKKGSPKGKEEANQRKGTDKVWSKQNFTQENKKQTKRKFKTGSETNRRFPRKQKKRQQTNKCLDAASRHKDKVKTLFEQK